MQIVQIEWTCASIEEAHKVSRLLVEQKYVACANIISAIESIYIWNNQLEYGAEVKVIFKTRLGLFDKVAQIIQQNGTYEVPALTQIAIDAVNESYADWVYASTKSS